MADSDTTASSSSIVTASPRSVPTGWSSKASPETSRGFEGTWKNDKASFGIQSDHTGSPQEEKGAEISWPSGGWPEHSIAYSTKAEDILERLSSSTATLPSGVDMSAIIGAALETGYRWGRKDSVSYDSLPDISHGGNSATSFFAGIKECLREQAASLLVSVGTRAAWRAVRHVFAV